MKLTRFLVTAGFVARKFVGGQSLGRNVSGDFLGPRSVFTTGEQLTLPSPGGNEFEELSRGHVIGVTSINGKLAKVNWHVAMK